MKVKHGFVAIISGVALAASLLFGSLPVAADTPPPPEAAIMTLAQQTKQNRDGTEYLVLTARLTRKDGYSLSERTINFYEENDVFGPAALPIGTAITSAAGIATLNYSTRLLGEHSVKATFSGDQDAGPVQTEATFTLDSLPPMAPLTTPTGLERVSQWALMGVGIIVLVIWLSLVGVLIGVKRGIAGRGA
jgi:hypothetical protein